MGSERPFSQLPAPVDPAVCLATHAAPPQPFAPAAEDAATSWALLQRDLEG